MILPIKRRQNIWHERLLLSFAFMLLTGWSLTVLLPYILFWSWDAFLHPDAGQKAAIFTTSLSYVLVTLIMLKLKTLHPGGQIADYIAPIIIAIYGFFVTLTFMVYAEVSRYLLLASTMCMFPWAYAHYLLTVRHMRLKLAVIPGGEYTEKVLDLPFLDARQLEILSLGNVRYDGIVADFEKIDTTAQKFLAECALNKTPVYNAKNIYESLVGRISIQYMSENVMGSTLPSPLYEFIKRSMDIGIVILTLPIVVAISFFVVVLIKFESSGPVLFKQIRIGQGNRPFMLYKFRSMRFDSQATAYFAEEDDPRITRIGRLIRKLRIDELPQVINVLKGDMSLIGPRPEQAVLVEAYEKKIPFYSYRHILKPGITGWAQVMHGYASSDDETRVKMEHDFFYIKHCSFSLDCMIIILTIRTVLTGFGAR